MKNVHSKIGFLHVIEACLYYSLSLQLKIPIQQMILPSHINLTSNLGLYLVVLLKHCN